MALWGIIPRRAVCFSLWYIIFMNLRIPGPTPLPPEVIIALTAPMISHRGSEYIELHNETVAMVKEFFQTKNDLFLFNSSGTGMMDAANS